MNSMKKRMLVVWAVAVSSMVCSLTTWAQREPAFWTNYAGTVNGYADDFGPQAKLNNVQGLAVDRDGVLYVADQDNHVIRRITATGNQGFGYVTTLAGQPRNRGFSDGRGTQAQFDQPIAVAVDAAKTVYVAEYGSHLVRKISPEGQVSLLAGTPYRPGFQDGLAVPAVANQLNHPRGLCVDKGGNVYIADEDNDAIRKVTTVGGISQVSTFVHAATVYDRSGNAHSFSRPTALAIDAAGDLYVVAKDSTDRTGGTGGGGGGSSNGGSLSFTSVYIIGPSTGGALKFFSTSPLSYGLAADATYLYVAHFVPGNEVRKILKADPATRSELGGYGYKSAFSGFNGVALDSRGRLFLSTQDSVLRSVLPPAIAQGLDNRKATVGDTFSWGVTIDTELPATIRWQKDGKDISGATGSNLTLKNVTTASQGIYQVVVWNLFGTNSASATLTVVDPPRIVTQPADGTGLPGASVSLSVTAKGGTPLSYQWMKNGLAIPGANSAYFVIKSLQAADAGYYSVIVSNRDGKVSSNQAVVKVLDPPQITLQPADVQVLAGSDASFWVLVKGTSPLSFQWLKGGVMISGATQPTLKLAKAQSADAGKYSVTVTNPDGKVTSREALLTVGEPPLITSQPKSQSVTAGGKAVFTVAAKGTAPLVYQWQKDGVDIVGAKGTALTLTVQNTSVGRYSVTVANKYGKAVSDSAQLILVVAPKINLQPQDRQVVVNGTAEFSVTVTGTTPFFYQWQKDGVNIPQATGAKLVLDKVQKTYAGQYSVVVSNVGGKVTSNKARLTVIEPVRITGQPQNQIVKAGTTATFTVTATGTAPLTYQWLKDTTAVPGGTSATLNLYRVRAADAGQYSVTVGNAAGKVSSLTAALTVKSDGPTSYPGEVTATRPSVSLAYESGELKLRLPPGSGNLEPRVVEVSSDLSSWTPFYTNSPLADPTGITLPRPLPASVLFYRIRFATPDPGHDRSLSR